MNEKAVGICLVGEFDSKPPPPKQLEVLRDRLVIPIMRAFEIAPANIVFHREYAPYKTCPGKQLTRAYLAQFIPGITV